MSAGIFGIFWRLPPRRFLAAHLKSLEDFPPSQGADTLSMKKTIEEAMRRLDNAK